MSSVTSPPSSTTSCGPLPSAKLMASRVQSQYSSSVSPFHAKTGTPDFEIVFGTISIFDGEPVLGTFGQFDGGHIMSGKCCVLRKSFDHALKRGGLVGFFPGDAVQIVHLAEVTIVGGFRINRAQQIE